MIHKHESGDKLFFTADHHFGHENIIKYCNRPFTDARHMNQKMIRNWNDTVPGDGIVYHLGDLCLGDTDEAVEYIKLLNGTIRILSVPWHHDRRWIPDFASILPVYFLGPEAVIQVGSQFIHLSHYPLAEWDRKHYGSWHLHGHSHGNYRDPDGSMDVGVDLWGFQPVEYGALEKMILPRERRFNV